MADTSTTVALNIGSQRISMAIFEVSKSGGLLLKAYDSESIAADPALEASRVSQTRVAIADLAQRLKVGKAKARYAISGQAVFTRFVKLPPLQEDNIEQLVTFEAQQHVPFPLDEVIWDYELIEGVAEKEVVIVAIKGDALDEINSAVTDSGLITAEVDVAPMALYNAFRATYGDPAEPVLLIDVGAKTSNLLYIEGRRFFTRSIPVGGAAVTSAIAKEYGISFGDAEHQKVSNGLVALGGGHTEQLDESLAALAMVVRNALTRLPAEIARTTNYYRSQLGGNAPKRIFLAGGGANLPYTLEFFEEKLNLPVEFFNPLQSIAVGKNVDTATIQRESHLMGELIGLGLRGIGKSAINIDLVPGVVEQTRAADRRKPFLIGAAALFLVGLAAWATLQHLAAGKGADRARTSSDQQATLEPYDTEITKLLRTEDSLRKVADSYAAAVEDHVHWLDFLAELNGAFASDAVWLYDLEPLADHSFTPPVAGAPAPPPAGIVRADFQSTAYGTSSLLEVRAPAAPTGRPSRPVEAPAEPAAKFVRLRGYWRTNPRQHNVVTDLLTRLRESTQFVSFTVPGPDGKPMELSDQQILRITIAAEAGELAQPFDLVLPLARPVPIR
jgi:type IV pilus assembly protein PilM